MKFIIFYQIMTGNNDHLMNKWDEKVIFILVVSNI